MYYSDELVEEIRSRNDIVDVISSYVRLTKKGSNYFGLCPFHNEKSASFSVSGYKQMYHCFGCGVGGNVITFIMEYENYTFFEALEFLAKRAGIELPENQSAEDKAKQSKRAKLLEINKEAGKFYYVMLRDQRGERGLEYLRNRGLTDETMQHFGLGFARGSYNDLYKYIKSKGFEDELISESGLFSFSEKAGMIDKFRNRVMFPIMDTNHRIIGFGGRVMEKEEPKYLNSPETYIFDKGRNLYGLNHAKSSRSGNIILCEGYMDVISMHQAGFTQAVASLGTAFTSGQANLLRRYTDTVMLCYDSDGAGVKAALRALPILKQAGISAKVISMIPYKDPDEFIKNLGADEFQKRIDEAENGFYFEMRMLESSYDIKDPDGKTKFVNEMCKRLTRFEDDIERETYIDAMAGKYNVSVANLNKMVGKYALSANNGIENEPVKSGLSKKPTVRDGNKKKQGLLLNWICDVPAIYPMVSKYIKVEDYTDEVYGKVAELLYAQIENNNLQPANIISCFTEGEEQREVAELFHSSVDYLETVAEKERALKDLMISVKRSAMENSDSAAGEGDNEAFVRMIEQKKMLSQLENVKITLPQSTGNN